MDDAVSYWKRKEIEGKKLRKNSKKVSTEFMSK